MAEQIHERQIDCDLGEFEFRADPSGDGLTLSGYIAKFGEKSVIQDWLGEYIEEIKRGAFANTIATRGAAKIKMQFNHGHDSTFGALPIGTWSELREDRKGLFGEGRIHDTWHTVPIRAAIESGALDGMSFKFKVIGETMRKSTKAGELDHRILTEVALFEAGPVVHPAYEGTTVGVRSRGLALWREAYGVRAVEVTHGADTVVPDTAVTPVGDTDPETRTVADPPVGITRRDMRLRALTALGAIPNDQDRGAA